VSKVNAGPVRKCMRGYPVSLQRMTPQTHRQLANWLPRRCRQSGPLAARPRAPTPRRRRGCAANEARARGLRERLRGAKVAGGGHAQQAPEVHDRRKDRRRRVDQRPRLRLREHAQTGLVHLPTQRQDGVAQRYRIVRAMATTHRCDNANTSFRRPSAECTCTGGLQLQRASANQYDL